MASPWTAGEDFFILDNPHLSARQVAGVLGRTHKAVEMRRGKLKKVEHVRFTARPSRPGEGVPRTVPGVGKRFLVAGTCHKCGRLLDGAAFPGARNWRNFTSMTCRFCEPRKRPTDESWPAKYRAMQNYTRDRAERHREPLTDADLKVWADPNKSLFEMALETKRTYGAVMSSRSRLGLTPAKPDPANILWIIRRAVAGESVDVLEATG